MSLVFMDSFDHYSFSQITRKWTEYFNGAIGVGLGDLSEIKITSDGRQGGSCITAFSKYVIGPIACWLTYVMPVPVNSLVCGFAFRWELQSQFVTFFKMGQFNLGMRSSRVAIWGPYGLYYESTQVLTQGQWYYIEMRHTPGQVDLRIDGTAATPPIRPPAPDPLAPPNTPNPAFAGNLDRIVLGGLDSPWLYWGPAWRHSYDDLYLCNDHGSMNNDFIGDVQVYALRPTANGAYHQMTPIGASQNYQCVNEQIANDDVTYVATASSGVIDTYRVNRVTLSQGTVAGVQMVLDGKKENVGTRGIRPYTRTGTQEGTGPVPTKPLGVNYDFSTTIMESNPATGYPWTINDVNSTEFGFKVVD